MNKEWASDYGVYYVGASLFSDDYRLYNQHFDHKGPAYYLFLNLVGKIIGFGPPQAIISLFFTTTIYLGSVYIIIKRSIRSRLATIIMLTVAINTLFMQLTNVSIALFQSAALIWSFYFIHQYTLTLRKKFFILSIFCWTLAVFTRIDAITYGVLFLFISLFWKRSINIVFTTFLILLIFMIQFFIFSEYFKFNFGQYFDHNILFNHLYNMGNIFLRVNPVRAITFQLLLLSGIPLVFLYILSTSNNLINLLKNPVPLLIVVLSLAAFVYSGSDRNYHIFIIYPGLIYFLIITIKEIDFSKRVPALFLLLLILYPCFLLICNGLGNFKEKMINHSLFSLVRDTDKEIVKQLKQENYPYGVFSNGWVYLFANVKPKLGLVPDVIYYGGYYYPNSKSAEILYQKTGVAKFHEELISHKDANFLVEEYNLRNPTIYLNDLLARSVLIKTIGDYQLRKINNPQF